MDLIKGVQAVFVKDLQTELRTRYALNTVLAFVGASLLLVLFSLRAEQLEPTPRSALIWIIILFAAISSLARSFVHETERQTFDFLRLHGNPAEVFLGKLLYNFIFTLFVNVVTFILYLFLLGETIADFTALLITLLLGTAGLAGVATLLASIISRADRKGAVFSVLSIPILFPLILILVRTTRAALVEGMAESFYNDFAALAGYTGAVITAGLLLFDYIWED